MCSAASRIREGGIVKIITWDLPEKARSGDPGQKQVASLLVAALTEEILDAFGTNDTVSSVTCTKPITDFEDCTMTFEHHLRNAKLLQQYVPEADACVLCGGEHATASCARLQ